MFDSVSFFADSGLWRMAMWWSHAILVAMGCWGCPLPVCRGEGFFRVNLYWTKPRETVILSYDSKTTLPPKNAREKTRRFDLTMHAATVPIVEVEAFRKNYGAFCAVSDLSFQVQPGQIVGLVGANGAGKTTTLRAITGILRATSGTIRVAGFDIAKEPVDRKSVV